MIYNNRNFPHPVLGLSDDYIDTNISVELKVKTTKEFIEITPAFVLQNKDLLKLIDAEAAIYLSHIYCRATFFREVFKSKKGLSEPIVIPSNKLNGEVEIDFFICTTQTVDSYKSSNFNADYGYAAFTLEKADIVGYAGKGKFYANKVPGELRAISALMNIDCTGEKNEPMFLDYSGERITIMLCVEDYNNYKLLKTSKQHFGLLLSSLVLPALVEALHFLNDGTSRDYQKNAWYKALKEIKDDSKKYNDPLRIAQNILDKPINKYFTSLTIDEAYE